MTPLEQELSYLNNQIDAYIMERKTAREYFREADLAGSWVPPRLPRILPAEPPKRPISLTACLLWGASIVIFAYAVYLGVRG